MSVSSLVLGNYGYYGDSAEASSKARSSALSQSAIGGDPAGAEDRVTLGAKLAISDDAHIDTVSFERSAVASTSADRISSIKARIDAGTYQISSEKIAEAMISQGVFTLTSEKQS